MTDPLYAPIELESLGVGVYGHGEVGGLYGLTGRGEGGARRQRIEIRAPQGGYF